MRAPKVNYSPEVAERFCAMIRAGAPEIRVCRMAGMPRSSAVWHWKQRYPEFRKMHDKACEERARGYAARGELDPSRGGRPTIYTAELADRIIAAVAEGVSLRKIARMEGMPGIFTLHEWMRLHGELRARYVAAWMERAEAAGDQNVEIADALLDSRNWPVGPGGEPVSAREAAAIARVRIEARTKRVTALAPREAVLTGPRFPRGAGGGEDGGSGLTYEEKLAMLE